MIFLLFLFIKYNLSFNIDIRNSFIYFSFLLFTFFFFILFLLNLHCKRRETLFCEYLIQWKIILQFNPLFVLFILLILYQLLLIFLKLLLHLLIILSIEWIWEDTCRIPSWWRLGRRRWDWFEWSRLSSSIGLWILKWFLFFFWFFIHIADHPGW